jgi:hypothetical protein
MEWLICQSEANQASGRGDQDLMPVILRREFKAGLNAMHQIAMVAQGNQSRRQPGAAASLSGRQIAK